MDEGFVCKICVPDVGGGVAQIGAGDDGSAPLADENPIEMALFNGQRPVDVADGDDGFTSAGEGLAFQGEGAVDVDDDG